MKYRIGIISDTHGLLREEVKVYLQGCDMILHTGDINSKAVLEELGRIAPIFSVRGNVDKEWADKIPVTRVVEVNGIRIFMIHNKKQIQEDVAAYDLIIYGHSHKYEEKNEDGTLRLNPGSCGPRRFTQPITFAVIEVGEDGSYRVEKIEIPHTQKGGGSNEEKGHLENGINGRDMKHIIKSVMRDTDKGVPVQEIAVRNNIDKELAEQICRLYLTHPGVSADGIMGKMGL